MIFFLLWAAFGLLPPFVIWTIGLPLHDTWLWFSPDAVALSVAWFWFAVVPAAAVVSGLD